MASVATPRHKLMTPIEEAIYAVLENESPKLVSRETLYVEVWGIGAGINTRTLDVHVCNLRKKLPDNEVIQGVYMRGYRLISNPNGSRSNP